MPAGAPASLSETHYTNVTAYLLSANGAKPGPRPFNKSVSVKIGSVATGRAQRLTHPLHRRDVLHRCGDPGGVRRVVDEVHELRDGVEVGDLVGGVVEARRESLGECEGVVVGRDDAPIEPEERELMQRALDENAVIVAQMTPFFGADGTPGP